MAATHTKYPARTIRWIEVTSSNVKRVGWDGFNCMYVQYLDGSFYVYHGVRAQRVVACARSASVGGYLHRSILPYYDATRLT